MTLNLKFQYVNWRGDEHEYVIRPQNIVFARYPATDEGEEEEQEHWVLNGWIVTRDGDPRSELELEGERRRSFILTEIRGLVEVQASS